MLSFVKESASNDVPTLESLVGIDSSNESNLSVLGKLAGKFSLNFLLEDMKESAVETFSMVRWKKILHDVFDAVPVWIVEVTSMIFKSCYLTKLTSAYEV